MTPRRILAWHFTPLDLLELARLSLLGALLVALDRACTAVERRIDSGEPATAADTVPTPKPHASQDFGDVDQYAHQGEEYTKRRPS